MNEWIVDASNIGQHNVYAANKTDIVLKEESRPLMIWFQLNKQKSSERETAERALNLMHSQNENGILRM